MKWTENPRMYVLDGQAEYKGEFKDGKSHGDGKMLMRSGRLIKGRFDKGVCGSDVSLDEFGLVGSTKLGQVASTKDNKSCHLF
jgi:hypothetical protein